MVMVDSRLLTANDFDALTALPENEGKRFELHQGEVVEMPSPSPLHAYVISMLVYLLAKHITAHQLGYFFADSVSYYLPNGDVFIPDASYLSFQRQTGLPNRFTVAPDLAVEVVSPGNRPREILNKVESYLESGTLLVWVIYPEEQVIDSYRRGAGNTLIMQKHTATDLLDGEDVLPGLQFTVREVFPPEPPR
jgi:Uma2 family endonuclease